MIDSESLKPRRKKAPSFQNGVSKATSDAVSSKSSQRVQPAPRGTLQKTRAALKRRIEDMGGTPFRQQGNHQMHVPGSQNRKKGCSI